MVTMRMTTRMTMTMKAMMMMRMITVAPMGMMTRYLPWCKIILGNRPPPT